MRADLVPAHEPAKPSHIGAKDRRQSALSPVLHRQSLAVHARAYFSCKGKSAGDIV